MHVQHVNLSHGLIINPYAMFNHEFKSYYIALLLFNNHITLTLFAVG